MLENKTTDDFIFVKQHIYRIFQWMHETPLINNGNTPVTDRLIADIRWMLEHHYYPSPGGGPYYICTEGDKIPAAP